jgi:hypothetical protein
MSKSSLLRVNLSQRIVTKLEPQSNRLLNAKSRGRATLFYLCHFSIVVASRL